MMGDNRLVRREFLGAALAGTAGVLGLSSARAILDLTGLSARVAAAEPPPEISTIRLFRSTTLCLAPQYVAEEFLHAEGFKTVQYVPMDPANLEKAVAAREIDLTMSLPGRLISAVDDGYPIKILGGVHVGCYELFGTDRIRSIRDLKGKSVFAGPAGGGRHFFMAAMLAHVGMDPRSDVKWVTEPPPTAMNLLAEGKIDGFIGFPPEPQELRAKKIGHVLVNTMRDRPWSNYFCCFVATSQAFTREYPVAAKRALRAILWAADVCAKEPARAARFLVDKGYAKRYDYALQAMDEIPYDRWREYNHEDGIRFHALRLLEGGLIKSGPNKIIGQGTDWRFLNEVKRELKSRGAIPGGIHHEHHRG